MAALFGRDAVFLLNAPVVCSLSRADWGDALCRASCRRWPPFRGARVGGLFPNSGWNSLHSSACAFAGHSFFEIRQPDHWSELVLFTVMGQNEFAVRWHGMSPERGAFLGMSLLLGARAFGAFLGPVFATLWAGHWQRRLQVTIFWGYIASAAGYTLLGVAGHLWQACLLCCISPRRKFDRVGMFDDIVADAK